MTYHGRYGRVAEDADKDKDIMRSIGPALWASLHRLSFVYPERATAAEREWAHDFLRSMGNLLPCEECRRHFALLVERQIPVRSSGREEFSRWAVDAHNAVNARLGKPLVSYEQAAAMWAPSATAVCPDCASGAEMKPGTPNAAARPPGEGQQPARASPGEASPSAPAAVHLAGVPKRAAFPGWVLALALAVAILAVLLAVAFVAVTGMRGKSPGPAVRLPWAAPPIGVTAPAPRPW